jgi:hypothetical protein
MNALMLHSHPTTEEIAPELPLHTMQILQELERERIRAYAEMLATPQRERLTRLETKVDDLLDSVHSLRRLEELAVRAADGNPITDSADLALIDANEETYRRMLKRQLVLTGNTAVVSDGLLPAFPQPIE